MREVQVQLEDIISAGTEFVILLRCAANAFQLPEKEGVSEDYREGEGTPKQRRKAAEGSQCCRART